MQPAFKKEILRVGIGTGLCTVLLLLGYGCLVGVGVLSFNRSVVYGGLCGTAVAVVNFILLCITLQHAVEICEERKRQLHLRWSYHLRLLLQGGWVITALRIDAFHPLASSLPLLFPFVAICILQRCADPGIVSGK